MTISTATTTQPMRSASQPAGALFAAGQNSTLTGTMAGQGVMEGVLNLRISPALRRLATRRLAILPALVATLIAGEHGAAQRLVLSQVILSLQLGFAVIPLVIFTSDRTLMGSFVNGPLTRAAGWAVGAPIVLANLWLVAQTFHPQALQ